MLGSSDSNKEEALYSAVMASRASLPNSSSDPQRVSIDDVEQADASCGESECRASCKKISLRDKGTNHGERGARTYKGSRGLCPSGVQGLRPPEADEIS